MLELGAKCVVGEDSVVVSLNLATGWLLLVGVLEA
jgi:hypothetical protein